MAAIGRSSLARSMGTPIIIKLEPTVQPPQPQTGVTRCNVRYRNRHVYVLPRNHWSESTRLWEGTVVANMSHTRRVGYI
eukprot:COSAG01_NODE_1165_length_11446_cov_16.276196_6_plen_79_part_00